LVVPCNAWFLDHHIVAASFHMRWRDNICLLTSVCICCIAIMIALCSRPWNRCKGPNVIWDMSAYELSLGRGHFSTGVAPSEMKHPLTIEHHHWEYWSSLLDRIMFIEYIHSFLVCLALNELHEKICLRSSLVPHIGHQSPFYNIFPSCLLCSIRCKWTWVLGEVLPDST